MSESPLSLVPAEQGRALPPAKFRCTSDRLAGGAAWIHATGELDLASVPRLRAVLSYAQGDARLVVLDLHDLAFMDCAAVQVVVDASRLAQRCGERLIVLRNPPEQPDAFDFTDANDAIDSRRLGLQAAPDPATR